MTESIYAAAMRLIEKERLLNIAYEVADDEWKKFTTSAAVKTALKEEESLDKKIDRLLSS